LCSEGTLGNEWVESLKRQDTKHLVQVIVLNVAKGIAIVVALLILRWIIKQIGEGEGESSAACLQIRVYELELELAKRQAKEIENGV
jgi:hypothetical protein